MLAILYLISQLDRANIANAKIEGLTTDLGLTGVQYNIVVSILFVTYVTFGGCMPIRTGTTKFLLIESFQKSPVTSF